MKLDKEHCRPFVWVMVICALLVGIDQCRAQTVLACSDPWGVSTNCGGCGGLEWRKPEPNLSVKTDAYQHWAKLNSLKPTDIVYTASGKTDGQAASCADAQPIALNLLTAPAAYVAPARRCWMSLIPFGVTYAIDEVNDRGVGNWYCDTPAVIYRETFCGRPSQIPKFIAAVKEFDIDKVKAWVNENTKRPCTAEEFAMADELEIEKGVKVIVAPAAGAATAPVYRRLDNNTQGSAISGLRAPKDARCGRKRLQKADGTATNYFQYGSGYTLCKVVGVVTK